MHFLGFYQFLLVYTHKTTRQLHWCSAAHCWEHTWDFAHWTRSPAVNTVNNQWVDHQALDSPSSIPVPLSPSPPALSHIHDNLWIPSPKPGPSTFSVLCCSSMVFLFSCYHFSHSAHFCSCLGSCMHQTSTFFISFHLRSPSSGSWRSFNAMQAVLYFA